jgi:hypothetical protein
MAIFTRSGIQRLARLSDLETSHFGTETDQSMSQLQDGAMKLNTPGELQ